MYICFGGVCFSVAWMKEEENNEKKKKTKQKLIWATAQTGSRYNGNCIVIQQLWACSRLL